METDGKRENDQATVRERERETERKGGKLCYIGVHLISDRRPQSTNNQHLKNATSCVTKSMGWFKQIQSLTLSTHFLRLRVGQAQLALSVLSLFFFFLKIDRVLSCNRQQTHRRGAQTEGK